MVIATLMSVVIHRPVIASLTRRSILATAEFRKSLIEAALLRLLGVEGGFFGL